MFTRKSFPRLSREEDWLAIWHVTRVLMRPIPRLRDGDYETALPAREARVYLGGVLARERKAERDSWGDREAQRQLRRLGCGWQRVALVNRYAKAGIF